MPAEWERHDATWIAWPHNRTDWPGKMVAVKWAFAEIARKITPGERLRILVGSLRWEQEARRALADAGTNLEQVDLFRIATDRGWTRDCGPIFVRGEPPNPPLAIARFRFNAWAKYPDWQKDDRVPLEVSAATGLPLTAVQSGDQDVVLEGGAVDVNGCGTVLVTEECLLDSHVQVRNPGLSRQELEQVLAQVLGTHNVLWLGRGIVGDDTHGHVDDFCRFVNPRTVVLCQEENQADSNYLPLEENRERIQGMRLEDGSRPEVVRLPMPAPLYFRGRRLPASYANFYICNGAVLAPTFNDPRDRLALGTLRDLFPDRTVTGIHAVDLVWGLGSIHCLTQPQPAVPPGEVVAVTSSSASGQSDS